MIIFKSGSKVGNKFNNKMIIRSNSKGWINKDLMMEQIEKIWLKFSKNEKEIKYLIMNKCLVHKEQNILKYLEEKKVYLDLIPDGTTHLLQPLDTCVNKPFKEKLRRSFEEWKESNKTKKGFYKSPGFKTLAE